MSDQNKRFLVIGGIIIVAVLSRLMPHPSNFAPIAAIALFGGAYFNNKKWAYLLPMLAMLFSDILLHFTFMLGFREFGGFYPDMIFVYAAFGLVVGIGTLLRNKINLLSVASGSLAGSVVFYLVTNFGAWLSLPMYPKNIAGLMEAYVAGIPFFTPTLLGDLVYAAIIFGAFELVLMGRPQWRSVPEYAFEQEDLPLDHPN